MGTSVGSIMCCIPACNIALFLCCNSSRPGTSALHHVHGWCILGSGIHFHSYLFVICMRWLTCVTACDVLLVVSSQHCICHKYKAEYSEASQTSQHNVTQTIEVVKRGRYLGTM